MTSISVLENIHKKGLFGDYEGKNENELVKIIERKDLLIVQIAQYKNSSTKDINIDGLKLSNEALKVNCNNDARILWSGPKNWLLTSTKKNLLEKFGKKLNKPLRRLFHYTSTPPLNEEERKYTVVKE